MEFSRFSDEIYVEIMKYMNNLSLLQLSRTSKKFNSVTTDKLTERKKQFSIRKSDNLLISVIRELGTDINLINSNRWDMITLKFNITDYDKLKDLFDPKHHQAIIDGIRLGKETSGNIYFQDYVMDDCNRLLVNMYLKIGSSEIKIYNLDSVDTILKLLKILVFRDIRLYKIKEDISRGVSITTFI